MNLTRYDLSAWAAIAAYAGGSVVLPVAMVELARDLGFALGDGGMGAAGGLHMVRTVTVTAAMLACGLLATRWGKRPAVGLSAVLMAAGLLACAAAPGYGVLLVALGVAGLGEGGVEALATPYVEALHPPPEEPGRYINLTHSFWSVGVVVAVLGAGALLAGGVSWRVPVALTALAAVVAAAWVLWPAAPGKAYPETPAGGGAGGAFEEAAALSRSGRFWLFFAAMGLAGGGEFCLTFWVASFIQLELTGTETSAWMAGVGTACFAGGMFVGRAGSGFLVGDHRLRTLLLASAAAGAVLAAAVPFTASLGVLLPLLGAAGLATAPFWPSTQSLAARRLRRADPTTLFVLLSCAGVPGCGVATWAMGLLGDGFGLRAAFFLVPACFLGLGLLLAVEALLPERASPDPDA